MEVVIYIIIFIIGAFIGSFASLATYRIPLKEDILVKHSYCPNCKAKLVLKDLIPIVSYIALRGKCSHCGEKIKIRYLILELVSGILFLLFIRSFNLDFYSINLYEIIFLILITIYFVVLVLIAGIDKEKNKIEVSLVFSNIIIAILYSIYTLYLNFDIKYNVVILLATMFFYILNIFCIKDLNKKYIINFVLLVLLSKLFANVYIILSAVTLTVITIILQKIISKNSKIPIVFYYIIYFASIFIGCNFIV